MGLFFLTWISWFSGWLAIGLEAICIASALYIAAEIAEELSSQVRTILKYALAVVLGLYTLLLLEGGPTKQIIMGMVAHISLLPLLDTFPFIEPISFTAIFPLLTLGANHVMWFHYFLRHQSHQSHISEDDFDLSVHEMSVQSIVGFFIVFVWSIPVAFFISMTETDSALPSTNNMNYNNPNNNNRGSIFRKIVDPFLNFADIILGRSGVNKRQ